MITKVSTKSMSHDEWLAIRQKSIGGSDAAAVLGLTKYNSPYALWCEKTGKITPDDISDKEAVRLGNDLEEYVAQRFTEATGKKVRNDNHIIYNSEYPFAHANIDRDVVGEDAGLECKTTSSWDIISQCMYGKYPDHWYVQMTHYMMVTGRKKWYLAVLCLGRGFFHFEIERNEDEIAALANAERQFWARVETRTPPPLDGTDSTADALKIVLGDSVEQTVDLTGVVNYLQLYTRLREQGKQIDEQIAACQAHIMQFMGTASKGTYGSTTVSFKTQVRKTFDRKAYEADHGAIPDQYFKKSTSRPFKVTVKE